MRVLFVSADHDVRNLMVRMVEDWNSTLVVAATVELGRQAMAAGQFDVVAVDVSPGDLDAPADLATSIRSHNSAAQVVVIGDPVTRARRDRMLASGVDDYVVKPPVRAAAGVRERTRRSIAIARDLWSRIAEVGRSKPDHHPVRMHGLEIDPAARSATMRGTALVLTVKEFELLTYLATRPGVVFSRDELLRAVWQSSADWQQPATVTEHMRRLRTKIELDPSRPVLLETVRGSGYRFRAAAVSVTGAPRLQQLAAGACAELAEAVIVTDLHFEVRSWNPAAEVLYGRTQREALGRHLADVVPWTGDDRHPTSICHALQTCGKWFGSGHQTMRDGTDVGVCGSTTLVRNEAGAADAIVFVSRRLAENETEVPPLDLVAGGRASSRGGTSDCGATARHQARRYVSFTLQR